MIVYYQKITKKIKKIVNHASKKHLTDKQLEADLNIIFKDEADNMSFSRFQPDVEAACEGIWDPNTNTMISPPPSPQPSPHPYKNRLKELIDKWTADPNKATTAEIAEYLVKAELTKSIIKDVIVTP